MSLSHSPLFTWFFYYKHLVPLKMGWSENRPHLFWYNVVIKFLCPYFLATIEKGGCAPYQFLGPYNIVLPRPESFEVGYFISILALKWPTKRLSGCGKTMS